MLIFAPKRDDCGHLNYLLSFLAQSEAEISLNLGEFGFARIRQRFLHVRHNLKLRHQFILIQHTQIEQKKVKISI